MFRRMDVLVTLMDDAGLEPAYKEVMQLPTEMALGLLETEGNKVTNLTTRFTPTLESFLDLCLEELKSHSADTQRMLLYDLAHGERDSHELASSPLLRALNNLCFFWKDTQAMQGYSLENVSFWENEESYRFIAEHAFFQNVRKTDSVYWHNLKRKVEPSFRFFSNIFLVAGHVSRDMDKETWDAWFDVWLWLDDIVQNQKVSPNENYSWLEPWK